MKLTLAKIFYLMADIENGIGHEELMVMHKIMKLEDVPESIFKIAELQYTGLKSVNEKTADCIKSLEQLNEDDRIKCLAWMSLIANSDGTLGDEEWSLISDLYVDVFDINVRAVLEVRAELESKLRAILI
jgi:hypothetical protein